MLGGFVLDAQQRALDVGNGVVQVVEAGGPQAVVGVGDQAVDAGLVVCEERVDVRLVQQAGALGLREDEVEQDEEAEGRVEGDEGEDEVGVVIEQGDQRERHPVHEPW